MAALLSILREVNDPRDVKARHNLGLIRFVSLAATLCGAKSGVDIADVAAGREEDRREIIDRPPGPPSHDTFSRVFRRRDPAELAHALTAFMTARRAESGLGPARGAVDGKSRRRGDEKGCAFLRPLMVSVWDTPTRLAIAQARTPGGNEIKATLGLPHSLALEGCTVTGDALHCHPPMAPAILVAKAHDVLGLKATHGPLFAAAEQGFAVGVTLAFCASAERPHGRIERRRGLATSQLASVPAVPGLTAIGRLEAERPTVASPPPPALSRGEDDARTRKDYGPENLAVIRRLAQNIVRWPPSPKSISRKRRAAMWSTDSFFELLLICDSPTAHPGPKATGPSHVSPSGTDQPCSSCITATRFAL